MRVSKIFTVVFCIASFATFCVSQSALLDLPRPSQHAVLAQRLGITDITVNYHRPLTNGRKIWGGVVPYGQVWRAGANENTTITFTVFSPPLLRRDAKASKALPVIGVCMVIVRHTSL